MTERVHRVQRVPATPRRIVALPEQAPVDSLALKQQAVQRFTARPQTLQRFTARPQTLQRQAVMPVLRAAALDRQEQTRLSQQSTQVQRQITALGEVTPAPRPAEPLAAPAKPTTPADWVTVMRLRAEEVAGRPLDARSSAAFTALQRQVAQTLAQGFRADRGDAQARYATYGEHLATLQRHAVSAPASRVVLGLIPSAERLPLQRATDEALQRFQAQEQTALNFDTRQTLQRQLAELDAEATQPVLARIQARRGSGNPLPEAIQRHLEQGLNHDLSRVRIHDDAEADKLAKGVNAIAFTTGTDIFFRSGEFNPNTKSGLELLAHEVTHTVQQSQGRVGTGIDPDTGLENEARLSGARLARTFTPASFQKSSRRPVTAVPRRLAPLTATHAAQRLAAGRTVQRSAWGDWWKTFQNKALEAALEVAARVPNGPTIVAAFKRSAAVFGKIMANPGGFFKNLTGAALNGFGLYRTNIATHLRTALLDWLAGTTVAATGGMIAFPRSLDGKALLGFGMNVLGLNTGTLIARLSKRYGAQNVQKAQGQLAVLQQARSGLHTLNEFRALDSQARNGLLGAARTYAAQTLVQQAVTWVSSFIVTGGLGPVARGAFALISTFLQNAQTFGQIGRSVLDSLQDIAGGQVMGAATKVEQNLGRVTGLVLKFVSKLLGLDKVGGALRKGLAAVQKPINTAIDRIVGSKPVQAVFQKLKGYSASQGGTPGNDLRSASEKKRDVDRAVQEGTKLLRLKKYTPEELQDKLEALRQTYQLKVLRVVSKTLSALTVERRIHGEVNPTGTGPAVVFTLPEPWQGTRKNPIPILWPKPATKSYPTIYLGGAKARRATLRTNAMLASLIGQDDPEVAGSQIRAFKPHQRVALSGGEVIGLSQENQVYTGKTLLFDASQSTKTKGGETFNRVARKYGLNIGGSRFNADHVLERQLGGQDTLDNLWPLDASINGSGGSVLHQMLIELTPGVWSKVVDMKNTNRKYFLKVTSTL
ncbi:DUF4157 domain-containing protein [Deinococcus sp. 12RED42]|nr:DUF4157 domain-containing protein [Deinococcus sp. 12RED42]